LVRLPSSGLAQRALVADPPWRGLSERANGRGDHEVCRDRWANKDDTNVRALNVTRTQAEYRDGPGALVATVKMAVGAMTDNRPQLGENKKIQF
jgi:hypothetical protein